MSKRRLFISFSGGETSAFMAKRLVDASEYDEVRTIFANTGQENEQTLAFVEQCDKRFSLNVEWVEAVIHAGRKAATARVVDYATASREGEPFEAMIRKYGIPNASFKHCTRDLKVTPLHAHLSATGWLPGTYDTAIGIRVDEIDRMSSSAIERRIIYPLVNRWPTTKPQINSFWAAQPFRLELKGYEGNCKWCWKKSARKHMTLIRDTPHIFAFPDRMERTYGHIGPEFKKRDMPPEYRRTFFRKHKSVRDLFADYGQLPEGFKFADDDAQIFSPDFDVGGGCEESCEVFSDEDMV